MWPIIDSPENLKVIGNSKKLVFKNNKTQIKMKLVIA